MVRRKIYMQASFKRVPLTVVYDCSNLNVNLISGTDGSGTTKKKFQGDGFTQYTMYNIHYDFIRYAWLAPMWSWYQELEEVGAKKVLWEQLGWGRSLGFSGYFILTLTFTLHHLGIFPCLVSHIARIQILSHVPSIFSIVRNLIIFMGREGVGVVVG